MAPPQARPQQPRHPLPPGGGQAQPQPQAQPQARQAGKRGDRTLARARQAAKRRTFPLINSQIIAAADTGDLELLMSTVEAYLGQMNLVNLSTALHRLAKMAAADAEVMAALHQHPALPGLKDAVREMLRHAGTGGAQPQCQALSNIAWSLATLQVADRPSAARIAELASLYLKDFKPFELSSLLWGFGKLIELDPEIHGCSTGLFQVAAAHVAANLQHFTFRCLVMLVWAFAAVRLHDAPLFRGLATALSPTLHTGSCHDLATVALSFGSAGIRQDKLFSDIAQKSVSRLNDFRAQDLVDVLCSFARNGFFHRGFLEGAALAAQRLELSAAQLHSFISAASYSRPRHHATRSAMLLLLPKCIAVVGTFSAEDLSSLALAIATCFYDSGCGPDEAPLSQVPLEVVGFFQAVSGALETWIGDPAASAASLPHRALATLTACLAAVGGQRCEGTYAVVAQEIVNRAQAMEPLTFCILLRTLPCMPRSPGVRDAFRALALEAARRLEDGQLADVNLGLLFHAVSTLPSPPLPAPLPPHRRPVCSAAECAELVAVCRALAEADLRSAPVVAPDLDLCHEPAERAFLSWGSGSAPSFSSSLAPPSSFVLAGASPGVPQGGRAERDARQPSLTHPLVAGPLAPGIVVKNTFVHVEDASGPQPGECGPPPLPPPLDIIPRDVPAEMLVAFRTDYQKFRTGKAVGAKGELSSRVV